ncbi:hypothetical protein Pcinc_042477 [Petrolisthes cinctipes]|uniref:Uncharacterized protein n=1 Tax=Petrolisthes cinctipes TaxID=88211 RepID=A0AAE1EIT1_PETCI|nr:hypothetical protein Pcinc_042477 [Petrolisthes cinctipes]
MWNHQKNNIIDPTWPELLTSRKQQQQPRRYTNNIIDPTWPELTSRKQQQQQQPRRYTNNIIDPTWPELTSRKQQQQPRRYTNNIIDPTWPELTSRKKQQQHTGDGGDLGSEGKSGDDDLASCYSDSSNEDSTTTTASFTESRDSFNHTTGGNWRRPMGRAEALRRQQQHTQQLSTRRIYQPVSSDDCGRQGVAAVPGQCKVSHSWQQMTYAPVAYQMQKMRESQCKEEEEEDEMIPQQFQDAVDNVTMVMKRSNQQTHPLPLKSVQGNREKKIPENYIGLGRGLNVKGSQRDVKKIGIGASEENWEPFDFTQSQRPHITCHKQFPSLGHHH